MSYAGTWERSFPSGAWKVWDDRTYHLGRMHSTLYLGYTKREAQQAHADLIRSLRKKGTT